MPITKILFFIFLLLALFLFGTLFWPFLVPFILAIILSSVFYNWYEFLKKNLKGSANIAALCACGIIIVLVLLPLGALISLLGKEALDLFLWAKDQLQTQDIGEILSKNQQITQYLVSLENTLGISLSPENLQEQIGGVSKTVGLFLYSQIKTLTSNVFTMIFDFVLFIFILFYLFRDGESILKRILHLIPMKMEQSLKLIEKTKQVGKAVFWGNLASASLQGIAGGLGFFFFGLPVAFLAGLLIAIVSLIPAVGSMLVFMPAALYLWITTSPVLGIAFLLYGIVVSNLIDNVLKPKLIESKIKVHPLLVFFSILGGVQAFGLLGVLYGPIIVTIFLSLIEVYEAEIKQT